MFKQHSGSSHAGKRDGGEAAEHGEETSSCCAEKGKFTPGKKKKKTDMPGGVQFSAFAWGAGKQLSSTSACAKTVNPSWIGEERFES